MRVYMEMTIQLGREGNVFVAPIVDERAVCLSPSNVDERAVCLSPSNVDERAMCLSPPMVDERAVFVTSHGG